jgi:hypothetical protein
MKNSQESISHIVISLLSQSDGAFPDQPGATSFWHVFVAIATTLACDLAAHVAHGGIGPVATRESLPVSDL